MTMTTSRITRDQLTTVRESASYAQWAASADCPKHGSTLIATYDVMPSMLGYGYDSCTTLRCGCTHTDGYDGR